VILLRERCKYNNTGEAFALIAPPSKLCQWFLLSKVQDNKQTHDCRYGSQANST